MTIRVLQGDNRVTLAELPDRSVHMAVTSPPYWGLRSYLPKGHELKPLELGSEPTPELFIANLLDVFRAVRRVLRDDGTLWVNLGDTYGRNGGDGGCGPNAMAGNTTAGVQTRMNVVPDGIKPLDRVGIPERFALAMQAAGWYWRDTIIWHKPAPMPSSVNGWRWERCKVKVRPGERGDWKGATAMADKPQGARADDGRSFGNGAGWSDCPGCPKCAAHGGWVLRRGSWRTTTAHEYIFMFAKTSSYFCDAEAVKQTASAATVNRNEYSRVLDDPDEQYAVKHDHEFTGSTANPRSVWTIGPQPLKHKHYAAFPEELPRRCILAGTPDKGCCPACGAPWARMVDKEKCGTWHAHEADDERGQVNMTSTYDRSSGGPPSRTVGWMPTCDCPAADPVPCTILDCFGGSGTVALVASMMGRNAISCELNPEYVAMHDTRFEETAPLLLESTP